MSIRNYNFRIGSIVTFAPGNSQYTAIYSPNHSFEIVCIADKTVYMARLDHEESEKIFCDSLKLQYGISTRHVIKPIEILQHAWIVHSKQEVLAAEILYGNNRT